MSHERRLSTSVLVLGACSALGCIGGKTEHAYAAPTGGDPDRGKQLIVATGCGACHRVEGIRTARGKVAAPLTDFSQRSFIAGLLPNTPDNLVRWIVNPQQVEPRTAMPALGLTEAAARDVAAYLYSTD